MKSNQEIAEICSYALLGGEYTRLDEFDAGIQHLQDAVERMKWGNYAVAEDKKTLRHYEHLLRVAPKLRRALDQGMRTKTTFKISELDQAVEQLYRLRLVEGWTGCLKLETNGKKLIISQFPSPNNWTRGYERVLMIEDWYTWGELVDFYERSDGLIEMRTDEQGVQGQYYDDVEILTRKEAFNALRDADFFSYAKELAYDNLKAIEADLERKELEA